MNNEFREVKKCLVIKLKQIGDVLLSIPVFRAVKEHFHGVYVSALVNAGTEGVLRGNPLIDEIILFERDVKKMSLLPRHYRELLFLGKIRSGQFDMVVDLTGSDRSSILSYVTAARYRLAALPPAKGFLSKHRLYTHRAAKKYDGHTVLKNIEAVRHFGINTHDLSVKIFVEKKARDSVRKIFREHGFHERDPVIHIHPVSRLPFKCWDNGYMAEVVRWITRQDIKVVLTSSPERQELETLNTIVTMAGLKSPSGSILGLGGKTSIQELAAVSEASCLFLGVDSAPMHIAAAVGTPVIALFGSGEERWHPWGEGHIVITKKTGTKNGKDKRTFTRENLMKIHPEDVIMELQKFLKAGVRRASV